MQKMGSLKPGAKYIYEKEDGVTYAREKGSSIDSRITMGWDYDPRTVDGRPMHEHMLEDKLWGEIRRAARTNSALQTAIERVKIIYHLSKHNGKK